jgi:hypothetical protein
LKLSLYFKTEHSCRLACKAEYGSFSNLRGNLPAPAKRLFDHFKSLSKRSVQVSTVFIDEYLTSQLCAECHRRTLVNLWAIYAIYVIWSYRTSYLRCTQVYLLQYGMDVMAAKNMQHSFLHMALNNNERPDPSGALKQWAPRKALGQGKLSCRLVSPNCWDS